MKPLENLNQVANYLDTIPCINNGGCAISALAVYRWLLKKGENCEIVYFYNSLSLFNKNEKQLNKKNNKNDYFYSCSHAVIQYKDKYFDSTGFVFYNENHYMYEHSVPEHLVVNSINEIGNWNDMFDREKYVEKIASRLEVDLSDIFLTEYDEINENKFGKSKKNTYLSIVIQKIKQIWN